MSEQKYVLVAPAYIAALYEGGNFNDFSVGKVTYEKTEVDNRRGYISIRLSEEGRETLKHILEANNHTDVVEFRHKIPGDWRYQELL